MDVSAWLEYPVATPRKMPAGGVIPSRDGAPQPMPPAAASAADRSVRWRRWLRGGAL